MARSGKSVSVALKVVSVVFCCVVIMYAVIDAQQFVLQHQQANREWQQEIAALVSPKPTIKITSGEVAGVTVASPSSELQGLESAQVVRVVDGDTLRVSLNGKEETVRMVGIDAPESVAPQQPVECFGPEAAQLLRDIVTGQSVWLQADTTQANRDRYGRLLRFVFLSDGSDVGLQLIAQGLAFESLYSKEPHQYYQKYVAAQMTAQKAGLHVWDATKCSQSK